MENLFLLIDDYISVIWNFSGKLKTLSNQYCIWLTVQIRKSADSAARNGRVRRLRARHRYSVYGWIAPSQLQISVWPRSILSRQARAWWKLSDHYPLSTITITQTT